MTKIIVVITSGIFYYLPKYDISLMFDSIFGGFFRTRFQTKHFTAYLRWTYFKYIAGTCIWLPVWRSKSIGHSVWLYCKRFTLIALVTLSRFRLYFRTSMYTVHTYIPSTFLTRNPYDIWILSLCTTYSIWNILGFVLNNVFSI